MVRSFVCRRRVRTIEEYRVLGMQSLCKELGGVGGEGEGENVEVTSGVV